MSLIAIRKSPPVSGWMVRSALERASPINSARTVVDHLDVLWLGRANEVLAPEKVHALASVQVQ